MAHTAKKRAVQRQTRRSVPHAKPGLKRAQSQAIIVRPPDPKPWLLSQDEVSILKNAVCKGATDEELKYCLTVARRYELDPFQKQIWFVPRWDAEAVRSDGKKGATVYTPQVSIDGLQYQAASHHADYGSFSEVEYGPMRKVEWHYQDDDAKPAQYFMAPEWARVEAWKKGATQPTVGRVWWDEIYPKIGRAPLVRRMPRLMLGKCAKAQAIRSAYPKKTGGLLIPEESYGREFQDVTPEGRLIVGKEFTPNEEKYLGRLTPEQRKVEEDKIRGMQQKDSRDVNSDLATPPANGAVLDVGATPAEHGPHLSYALRGNGFEITGPDDLKAKIKDLIKEWKLWTGKTIFCSPDHLGKLLRKCEERNIPLQAVREPGE